MAAYLQVVSTRKVDDPVKVPGAGTRVSSSEASQICADWDVGFGVPRGGSLLGAGRGSRKATWRKVAATIGNILCFPECRLSSASARVALRRPQKGEKGEFDKYRDNRQLQGQANDVHISKPLGNRRRD